MGYTDKNENHVERLDIFSTKKTTFTYDFEVGDDVVWLGHDNVYGYMYGESYTATQEIYDKKYIGVGPFMRIVPDEKKKQNLKEILKKYYDKIRFLQ